MIQFRNTERNRGICEDSTIKNIRNTAGTMKY